MFDRKSFLAMPVLVVLALIGVTSVGAQQKIAVIDVQSILTESAEGRQIIAQLEQFRDSKAAELQLKQKELTDLQSRYQETRLTLAEDKLAEMQKQLEDETIALQRAQDDARRELEKRQAENFQGVETRVLPIIEAVGREFGYTAIFNKFQSGLLYADDAIDITTVVIERFNAASGGSTGQP